MFPTFELAPFPRCERSEIPSLAILSEDPFPKCRSKLGSSEVSQSIITELRHEQRLDILRIAGDESIGWSLGESDRLCLTIGCVEAFLEVYGRSSRHISPEDVVHEV